MDTETAEVTPILKVAWTRVAQLDAIASRRSKGHLTIRRWITILGVLATFFAILTQLLDMTGFKQGYPLLSVTAQGVLRVHRGYAWAPDRVLSAIVRYVRPGTRRATRRSARAAASSFSPWDTGPWLGRCSRVKATRNGSTASSTRFTSTAQYMADLKKRDINILETVETL